MNPDLLAAINQSCEAKVNYGTPPQEIVPTGLPALDTAIGGGIPRGRIVEVYGNEASGKTALALHLAKQLPGPTLFVDADHGLSPCILQGQDLYLLNAGTLEDTLDACLLAVRSGAFGAVVIDSVAALPTNEDMRENINSKFWCQNDKRAAKVLSKAMPILTGALHHTGCTLILVNQMRIVPGVIYGNPERPTGGKAIQYYAALRLNTGFVGHIKGNGWNPEHLGQLMRVKVTKNKLAPPLREAELKLMYARGLSA